jgi:DNA mismatch endonuclease (patch repair protein)
MNEVSPTRRKTMQAVKGKNTKPELLVRRLLYSLGYRYRLHRQDLPGKPDIVFPGRKKVLFVHGCFWHGHDCKRGARESKTNIEYWSQKIAGNKARDQINKKKLLDAGWDVMAVWECQLNDKIRLNETLVKFLEG